jgi:D-alanyl-D-alanine dipeptidase
MRRIQARRPALAVRALGLSLIAVLAGCSSRVATFHPLSSDDPLVDVADVVPGVVIDIRYASDNNFLRRPLYATARCLLRASVARRLRAVSEDLAKRHLRLKVLDAYRPLSVQRQMWRILPDARYVADPATGSRHNRGAAVDVTLLGTDGRELEMPSGFDEFTIRAHRDYTGGTATARRNRRRLEEAMTRHGFVGLPTEWWHFDAPDWKRYPVLDRPLTD